MTENVQLATDNDAQISSRGSRIIPVALLVVFLLAAMVNTARGRNDQTLEGVVVMDYPAYRFYPGLKDCHLKGTSYWLVPNQRFDDAVPVPSTNDFSHLERLFHATWKVKLHGNLSPIGRYGFQGKYWRELDVLYVIDAEQLDCKGETVGSLR